MDWGLLGMRRDGRGDGDAAGRKLDEKRRGRIALVGSAGVHLVAIGLAVWTSLVEARPMEFVTYEIELVSPPATVRADEEVVATPEDQLTVETPDVAPPEVEDLRENPLETPIERPPEPEPEPEEVEETRDERQPEPPPEEEPPPEQDSAETASPEAVESDAESGEDIDVRVEGLRRDYPAYYADIVRQIDRCFRWSGGGSWDAAIYFVINADGSVDDVDIARSSGNFSFDLDAVAAVECAGRRLQPLPEDLPYERLPVRFNFRPRGSGLEA